MTVPAKPDSLPLVTILIATKDRPGELRRTLALLREQRWPALELIVIDDGSAVSVEPVVRESWPDAVFVRTPHSAGQCQRRSEGFSMAKGTYILQLDDDSCPAKADAIEQAVRFMEAEAEIGILSFYIFNGETLPENLPAAESGFHQSFVGCGALLRTQVVRDVGGYCDFFENEWEEEELSIRMMKAGWGIYFFPPVVIHHHVSPRNRRSARTWSRGLRNKLWASLMHLPARRLPVEMTWVLGVGFLDAIRLARFGVFLTALAQFVSGLPKALRLRDPMAPLVLRRYDAMRFRGIQSKDEYRDPPPLGLRDIRNWYRSWLKRPRQRSIWDRRPGDTGTTATVSFAHEFRDDTATQKEN